MRYINAILVIFFNMSLCVSGTIDPLVPDEKYVDYAKDKDCIVKIVCIINNSKDKNIDKLSINQGSAVVINKNWVLTAAHLVDKSITTYIEDSNEVKYNIKFVIKHYNFNVDNPSFADIALAYSEKEIYCKEYPPLYDVTNETGKECSLYGYGFTGDFINGKNLYDGRKRGGTNIIDGSENDLLICSPSMIGDKTSLEFLTAIGDSGGGLFIDNKLAGIHSVVTSPKSVPDYLGKLQPNKKIGQSTYFDNSGHTRISKFKKWIEDTINSKK